MQTVTPFSAPVQPDPTQAVAFFKALFPSSGYVHFRAVPEPKDSRTPTNHWYEINERFPETLAQFLDYCAVESRAAFFLPALATPGKSHKDAVQSLPCVVVDFDKGDPAGNLAQVEALIGPATAIVESGGATEQGPKLHAYWRLEQPAMGSDVQKVCALREALATRFGGDPAFKQEAQVIRIPGSVHFKSGAKPVRLRSLSPATVYLPSILSTVAIQTTPNVNQPDNYFDFNNVVPFPDNKVERALTQPILAEGASTDGMTRFEGAGKAIGHFIHLVREGTLPSLDAAWERAKEWNAATLDPPWEESRLRNDFDRLTRQDIQEKGPIVLAAPILQAQAAGWRVTDWKADRFQGEAPARRWLVDGLIPSGTPGVFAAVGDAGKSMLALRLALYVSSYPAPDMSIGLDTNSPRFFGQPVAARGAAVILTAEDDADEVHRRLNGLDPTHARAGRPLYVVPMLSTGGARSILVDGPAGPQATPFWSELSEQLRAIPDLKLVVLDPLSSFVGADINKDNLAGAALMTMLAELAASTGAAVMLVHHFAKGALPSSLSDARGAIRGAGALVDNGRWALTLWEADQDDAYKILKTLDQKERSKEAGIVYFGGLAKGNAPGAKVMRTLVRGPGGVLEDVTDIIRAATPRADEVDDQVYNALVAYKTERPRWNFPMGKTSIAKYLMPVLTRAQLNVTVRTIEQCMQRLLERGLIVETETSGKYEPMMD